MSAVLRSGVDAPLPVPLTGAVVMGGVVVAADLLASFYAARSGNTLRLYRGALDRFARFLGVPE